MQDETERVRSVFDDYARSRRRARRWSAANAGNQMIREEVVAAVRSRVSDLAAPSGDVLDIGCGSGWWLRTLAQLGIPQPRLHGVDLLEQRLDGARAALPDASLAPADARALPFPDGRFWLATLFLVLSSQDSSESQRRSLIEARRVLQPGGHLVVWDTRVPNPANRATTVVRLATLRDALGEELDVQPVTVLPALARRLGRRPALYRRLAATRLLCTHRLVHLHGA